MEIHAEDPPPVQHGPHPEVSFLGHVFESCYTAYRIGDDRYFMEASRYIHLKSGKAKIDEYDIRKEV